MIRLALKMLFGDTAKYLTLIVGLVFATFLMIQQLSIFLGLMRFTTSTLRNVPAPIWVVESSVEQIAELNPMRDTDLSLVRSVNSVDWAMPMFYGLQRVRLEDGALKTISLVGIDSTTFIGAPVKMLEGRLEDLRLPHTVIVDELSRKRLALRKGNPLRMGDAFEINDQEARIVGFCQAYVGFAGGPYVYTTYDRALQYVPNTRKMLSGILAAPRKGVSVRDAIRDIEKTTGLRAYQNEGFDFASMKSYAASGVKTPDLDFNSATIWWYFKNTSIPMSFGITVIVGLIVGIAISCQTFYAFILENMRYLGALKAMGTSTWTLCRMLLAQAFTVGLIGYGVGLFFVTGFAKKMMGSGEAPFYMPWMVPTGVLGMILLICTLCALIGIIRVARLEAAAVFRA